jgi:predicted Zn-dependent protease
MTTLRAICVFASVLAVGSVRSTAAAPSSPPSSPSAPRPAAEQASPSAYDRGIELVEAEKYEEARKVFATLEAQEPENPDVLNMLAYTQRKTGQLDEAMGNYRKALALRPKFPQAREYLAEAYLQAALREAETLRGYGASAEDELGKLQEAFQAAAAQLGGSAGEAVKTGAKKSGW